MIFIVVFLFTFIFIHFIGARNRDGNTFELILSNFIDRPITIVTYVLILFVPALIASTLIPACIKWIRSGS